MGCQDACATYLEVKAKKDFTPTGYRLCCAPPTTLLSSEKEEMLLLFRSDPGITAGYKGFRLRYMIGGLRLSIFTRSANADFDDTNKWFGGIYSNCERCAQFASIL